MIKVKNILALLFLVILTVGMITIPILLNSLNLEYSFQKENFWDYAVQTNHKLTSAQVAEFYNNFSESVSFDSTASDDKQVKDSIMKLFDSIFGEKSEACSHMSKITDNNIKYSQTYQLISIDNIPTILNMISACIIAKDEYIEFRYEAKTGTLLSLFYSKATYDEDESIIDVKDLQALLNNYCKNKLHLQSFEYQVLEEVAKGKVVNVSLGYKPGQKSEKEIDSSLN